VTPLERVTWALLFAAIAAALQLIQQAPFDSDTGFHLAIARMIKDAGLPHAMPMLPFSWQSDHWADKELLFHVLLVPVAGLNPTTAARIAGTFFGAVLLGVLFSVLAAERVKRPGLWVLLALASSGAFALRFALVRPHLLAVTLALAVTWAAARRRLAVLGAAALLYPLSSTSWHTALVLVLIVELAHVAAGQRPSPRPLGVAAAGLAVGVLVHPDFPRNLSLFWLQNYEILVDKAWGDATGFQLGAEFKPFDWSGIWRQLLFPVGLVAAALVYSWRRRRADAVPLAFAAAAAGFLVITLKSQRFIEYLAPFAAAAAALSIGRGPLERRAAVALPLAAFAFTALFASEQSVLRLRKRVDIFRPAVAQQLQGVIPQGAQVFTCDWDLTGEMMLALPGRKFMVALDPVFFWKRDPVRYRRWFELVRNPPADAPLIVAREFGAQYVLCGRRPQFEPFVQRLARNPAARLVVQTEALVGFVVWDPLSGLPP